MATLFKVAKALEVNVAHFFQEQEEDLKVSLTRFAERVHSVKRSHQQDGEVGYLVDEYYKIQGRFRHLDCDALADIQAQVDQQWQRLKSLASINSN